VRAPNLNKYVEAFALQVQDLEDAITEVMLQDLLTFAEGENLDTIGDLVGAPRLGLSDEDYREAIEFQVFVNHHKATPENLAEICRRLCGATAVEYIQAGPAVYRLRVDGGTLTADIRERVHRVTAAGVRLLDVHRNPYAPRRFGDTMGRRFSDEEE
jgi:hypothetical protein